MKKFIFTFLGLVIFFAIVLVGFSSRANNNGEGVTTNIDASKLKDLHPRSANHGEGIRTDIDPSRLNDILEWVNNAKFTLDMGNDSIPKSPIPDQEHLYANLIDRLLQGSDKPNEFLMRNILLRVKSIYRNLKNLPSTPKRNAFARRILQEGVDKAQSYYAPDKRLLELSHSRQLPPELRGVEFAKLGIEWASYMLSLYYQTPDDATKLQLMKDMMGIMYNDINDDDAVRRILAPISGDFAVMNEEIKASNPSAPIEQLAQARKLRGFMEQRLIAARQLLQTYGQARY